MTYQEFTKRAKDYAAKIGCESSELYYANGESFEVNANAGEIDRYSVSREAGVSVRGWPPADFAASRASPTAVA